MIVVSDTTPIVALLKAGRLELLHDLFGQVVIPDAVYAELSAKPKFQDEAEAIDTCGFIARKSASDTTMIDSLRQIAGMHLGESEAIVLYGELHADLLLVDDAKARKTAANLKLNMTGTVGIVKAGYLNGMLTREDVVSCITNFKNNEIFISEAHYEKLLNEIDEIEAR